MPCSYHHYNKWFSLLLDCLNVFGTQLDNTPCKEWFANLEAKFALQKEIMWLGQQKGTKYTLLLNKSYLVTRIKYFHSVTCITMPDKFEQTVKNSQLYNDGIHRYGWRNCKKEVKFYAPTHPISQAWSYISIFWLLWG